MPCSQAPEPATSRIRWFLWRGGIGLRFLAAGNLLTATLAVVWLALAPGFSAAGAALVAAAIAALAILAALQLASALRYPNAESTPASGGGISSGSSAATSSGG